MIVLARKQGSLTQSFSTHMPTFGQVKIREQLHCFSQNLVMMKIVTMNPFATLCLVYQHKVLFYLRIACIYKNSYVYVISCCIFFSSEVRCCYCEYQGLRIVHPVEKCWEGASGFERIACGEHNFTNAEIVSRAKLIDNQVMGIFVKDYIYLDPTHDAKLIQAVNRAESVMNLDLDAEMRRIKSVAAAGHYPQEASFLI